MNLVALLLRLLLPSLGCLLAELQQLAHVFPGLRFAGGRAQQHRQLITKQRDAAMQRMRLGAQLVKGQGSKVCTGWHALRFG